MLLNLKRMPVAVFVKENAPLDHTIENCFRYDTSRWVERAYSRIKLRARNSIFHILYNGIIFAVKKLIRSLEMLVANEFLPLPSARSRYTDAQKKVRTQMSEAVGFNGFVVRSVTAFTTSHDAPADLTYF